MLPRRYIIPEKSYHLAFPNITLVATAQSHDVKGGKQVHFSFNNNLIIILIIILWPYFRNFNF